MIMKKIGKFSLVTIGLIGAFNLGIAGAKGDIQFCIKLGQKQMDYTNLRLKIEFPTSNNMKFYHPLDDSWQKEHDTHFFEAPVNNDTNLNCINLGDSTVLHYETGSTLGRYRWIQTNFILTGTSTQDHQVHTIKSTVAYLSTGGNGQGTEGINHFGFANCNEWGPIIHIAFSHSQTHHFS
jgi:hypothetical protein